MIHFRLGVGALFLAAWMAGCAAPSPLLDPDPDALGAPAPDSFRVAFATSAGPFQMTAHRAWSPAGVDRFHYLVRHGFYDGTCFFRVVEGFVAQFGLAGQPAVDAVWQDRGLPDEPVRRPNERGRVAFARSSPESRTTQLFINLTGNPRLDTLTYNGVTGFPPIGEVTRGMDVVDRLYAGYGEAPQQDAIRAAGHAYLQRQFPKLDCVTSAQITETWD